MPQTRGASRGRHIGGVGCLCHLIGAWRDEAAIIWSCCVCQTKRATVSSSEIEAGRIAAWIRDLVNHDLTACYSKVFRIREGTRDELSFLRCKAHRSRDQTG